MANSVSNLDPQKMLDEEKNQSQDGLSAPVSRHYSDNDWRDAYFDILNNPNISWDVKEKIRKALEDE